MKKNNNYNKTHFNKRLYKKKLGNYEIINPNNQILTKIKLNTKSYYKS